MIFHLPTDDFHEISCLYHLLFLKRQHLKLSPATIGGALLAKDLENKSFKLNLGFFSKLESICWHIYGIFEVSSVLKHSVS